MKIYYHPVSTTSRPLMLFAAANDLDVDFQVVDLMVGEHVQAPFTAKNPNQLVPVLEDGDLRLTESSAILKYLAEKSDSPAYPKDLKKRAKVHEALDWINTQLCRDLAYGLVYPQIFPNHTRPTDEHQKGTLAWAKERTQKWFGVLDQHFIGQRPFINSDQITIADYFGSAFVSLGETIRIDYKAYPNLNRWLGSMKKVKGWDKVHEVFYGFAGSMKDKPFESI